MQGPSTLVWTRKGDDAQKRPVTRTLSSTRSTCRSSTSSRRLPMAPALGTTAAFWVSFLPPDLPSVLHIQAEWSLQNEHVIATPPSGLEPLPVPHWLRIKHGLLRHPVQSGWRPADLSGLMSLSLLFPLLISLQGPKHILPGPLPKGMNVPAVSLQINGSHGPVLRNGASDTLCLWNYFKLTFFPSSLPS